MHHRAEHMKDVCIMGHELSQTPQSGNQPLHNTGNPHATRTTQLTCSVNQQTLASQPMRGSHLQEQMSKVAYLQEQHANREDIGLVGTIWP